VRKARPNDKVVDMRDRAINFALARRLPQLSRHFYALVPRAAAIAVTSLLFCQQRAMSNSSPARSAIRANVGPRATAGSPFSASLCLQAHTSLQPPNAGCADRALTRPDMG
jgi:hypothetical protein